VLRRIMLVAAAFLSVAGFAPAAAHAASCAPAAAATYRHSFDGPSGSVTVTAQQPLCSGQSQSFALAAYTAGSATSNAGQFLYSTDRGSITAAKRSLTLKVTLPRCYTQVNAFVGSDVINEATSSASPYGDAELGSPSGPGSRSAGPPARYSGGTTDCTPSPTVTFASSCDGAFTATLTNSDRAGTYAAFVADGSLIRVAPGASRQLAGPARGGLTIRTSTFETYVGTWQTPAGCTATAAPPTAAPAAPPGIGPSAGGEGAGGPEPTPSATTASPATTAGLADDWYTPAATTAPTTTAVATSRSSMSAGSVVAIALGLLLIVGGGFLLTRVIRTIREDPGSG
jgi:hypothetical protein